MNAKYKIELHIDTGTDELEVFEVANGQAFELTEARQAGAQFFMAGYMHTENSVALASDYTLFAPTQIKKVRLVAQSVLQASPGLKIVE